MLARSLHRSGPMSPFRTLRAAARASRRSVIVAVDDWLLSRSLGYALQGLHEQRHHEMDGLLGA